MIILQVKFSRSPKVYDYLLDNPKSLKIDKTQIVRLVTGSAHQRILYSPISIISYYTTETLPSHVTQQLTIGENNYVYPSKVILSTKTVVKEKQSTSVIDTAKTGPTTVNQERTKPSSLHLLTTFDLLAIQIAEIESCHPESTFMLQKYAELKQLLKKER